jgi:hypothetical protein
MQTPKNPDVETEKKMRIEIQWVGGPVLYCSEGEITAGGGVVWVKAKKS